MGTPVALPPPQGMGNAMQRRSFEENAPLNQRATEQGERLRKEIQGTPPGVMRYSRAQQAETASHIQEWLSSPGLQPPR